MTQVAPAGQSYATRMGRYVLAAIGPIAVAGANFLLSFTMLRLGTPAMFGAFTTLFAAAWFGIALASALFCAPMQAAHGHDASGWPATEATVLSAAIVTAVAAGFAFTALATALGLPIGSAAAYGLFGMLTILRCVGRAWSYVRDRPWRVTLSDVCYALVTLAGFAAAVGLGHVAPYRAVYPALALGMAVGIGCFGGGFPSLLGKPRREALARYSAIWRAQSRWSLFSVAATEAVANAHIYLLTLLLGAAAVAPVAASALLVRPINVIQNALIEYERPQMARFLGAGAMGEVDRSRRLFRGVLLVVWTGTIALAAAILALRPELAFPAGYSLSTLRLATALWAIVSLVIVVQVPDNVLLQAAGAFHTLARASMRASLVSVAGVLVAIASHAPVWTIGAIALGWLASTAFVRRAVRDLLVSREGGRTAGAGA